MHEALQLLFPIRCITCNSEGAFHCSRCAREWQGNYSNYIEGIPTYSAALYSSSVAHILMRAKEDNDKRAREILATAIRRFIPINATVAPIPSSESSIRRRGYDHSLLLARMIDRSAQHLLHVNRKIADQTQLTHAERHANLKGAYSAGNYFFPRVVLIDDVITSGSSIREAIRALREVKITPEAVISAGLATHPIPNTITP